MGRVASTSHEIRRVELSGARSWLRQWAELAGADDRTHVYVMPQPIHNAFCRADEGDVMSWFVPPIIVPAFLVLLIVAQGAYLAFSH